MWEGGHGFRSLFRYSRWKSWHVNRHAKLYISTCDSDNDELKNEKAIAGKRVPRAGVSNSTMFAGHILMKKRAGQKCLHGPQKGVKCALIPHETVVSTLKNEF